MKTILLIVLLLACSALPAGEESSSTTDSIDIEIFGLIIEISSSEERSWAKPIEHVDMERILELMDAGLVTFHEADWYAVVDENNE